MMTMQPQQQQQHQDDRPLWRKLLGLYGEKDVPPDRIAGSVVVVTGANSGVGFELCASLCRAGAGAIFCLGRDEAKVKAACAQLEAIALDSARARLESLQRRSGLDAAAAAAVAVPSFAATQLIPLAADLESAGEVARAAFSIEARAPHVDYVVCCAGRYVDAPFHLAEGWGPHAAPVDAGGEAVGSGAGGEGVGSGAPGEGGGNDNDAAAPEKKKPWGIESTIATNYYAHALLVSMLMPKLLLRAQDMLSQGALHRPPSVVAAAGTAQQSTTAAATTTAATTSPAPTTPKPPSAAAASAAQQPRSAPVLAGTSSGEAGGGTAAASSAAPITTTTPPPTTTTHAALRGMTAVTGRAAAGQRPLSPGGKPSAGRTAGPAAVRLPHGSRPLARARVVWVASQAEQYAPALGEFLLEDPTGERLGTGGMAAYARSKAMGLLFVRELARRVALGEAKAGAAREAAAVGGDVRKALAPPPRPVDVIAVHPGLVHSPLMGKTSPREYPVTALLSRAGAAVLGVSPRQGAAPLLFAISSPFLDGHGGAFVGPSYITNLGGATVREPVHPDTRDPDMWALCFDATRRVLLRSFRPDSRVAARLQAVLGGHHRALPAFA